jgi:Xaa-Pro aminopeptidase
MPSSTRSDFPLEEYAERIERVRAVMRERELDALVVCSPENVCYLIGLDHLGYFAFTAVILGLEGPPAIVIRAMEQPTLDVQAPGCVPFTYGDEDDPADRVVAAVRQAGAAGIELGGMYLPVAVWDRIRAAARGVRWADASELVEGVRAVKSPAEIEHVRRAAGMSDAALKAGLEVARAGASERDVSAAVHHELVRSGSAHPGFVPLIRSADTLPLEHVTWSDRRLEHGDTLFCELSGCSARYHAPVSRMAYVGAPPAGSADAAAVVAAGLDAILSALRPGASGGGVYDAWQAAMDAGLGRPARRRHHCGYMVGIGFPPSWSGGGVPVGLRAGDLLIRAGMTFHVMSWLLGQGPVDYGVSDTVVVTDDGCELLTGTRRDPIVV